MGIRGPGRPRKSKSRADAAKSLALLDPIAVDTIGEAMRGEMKDRLRYEAACMVYWQNHGKPKYAVDLSATGEIVLRVKYDD